MKRIKSLAYMLVVALSVMLLSGCGQKVDIQMNSDGSGNMTVTFMIEASEYDNLPEEYEKQMEKYNYTKGTETYNKVEYVTFTKKADFDKPGTLQNLLTSAEEYSKVFGGSSYAETASEFLSTCVVNTHSFQGVFSGGLDRTCDKDDDIEVDVFSKISITFPTEIKYTNGTISSDKKTASWMLEDCMNDKLLRASTVGSKDFPADTKAPVISGAKHNAYYRDEVELFLSDNVGIKTATVNGKRMGNEEYFWKDARYVVKATDFAGNTASKTFIVDSTAPIVKGVANSRYYNTAKIVKWEDKYGIKSATLNGKSVKSGVRVYTSKKHKLVVTDKAGNKRTVNFVIDQKLPTIKGVAYGKTYRTPRTITFSDNIGVKSATLNGSTIRNGKKVSKPGTYTVRVTDKAGNVKSVKFKIKK